MAVASCSKRQDVPTWSASRRYFHRSALILCWNLDTRLATKIGVGSRNPGYLGIPWTPQDLLLQLSEQTVCKAGVTWNYL